MKICVIGCGAIGLFYGLQLRKCGHDVVFVSRQVTSVTAQTVSISSDFGDSKTSIEVWPYGHSVSDPFDVVMVCTKWYPDLDVHGMCSAVLGEKTMLVLLQNGVGIESIFADAFPTTPIISGLAFTCVYKEGWHVVHEGYGALKFGAIKAHDHALGERFVSQFIGADVDVSYSFKIQSDRWLKLVWNIAFNTLSVIGGGLTTTAILHSGYWREIATRLMTEAVAVANAYDVDLSVEHVRSQLSKTEKMHPYKTSMLRDFERHNPLEREAILGNVLRLATEKEIAVPAIATAYRLLS